MKKRTKIIIIVLAVLAVIYFAACWILIDAALVPSFMESLDAFEEFTEKGLEVQVHTEDILTNQQTAMDETKLWYKSTESEQISITTEDGYELVGRLFYNYPDSHNWAFLLHGYTGWKEELYPVAKEYSERGYNVLVPDMRCSGSSDGDFIGMGWTDRLDNMIWLEEITKRDLEAKIVIHGQSMGAACALMMAGEDSLSENVKAIISDSAYTDAFLMFKKQIKDWTGLPSFPILDGANFMLKYRAGYTLKEASALEQVKKAKLPILYIHGKEDAFVPCFMSETLYEATPSEKEILLVDGAGHVQAQDKVPDLYYGTVFEFLEKQGFVSEYGVNNEN